MSKKVFKETPSFLPGEMRCFNVGIGGRFLTDRNGQPFDGDAEALKRHNAKLRKQESRARAAATLALPTPEGTKQALKRVCLAAGFEDPREFLTMQIHRLDGLLTCDRHAFNEQTKVTVTVSGLEKYFHLLGVDPDEPSDDSGEN